MGIRVGIVGLQSVYWPNAFANCLSAISHAELVACADLGYDPGSDIYLPWQRHRLNMPQRTTSNCIMTR